MNPGVRAVQALADYRLLIVFENGARRIFDLSPWLAKGAFCELRDEAVFRTVRVSFDTVEWANGCDLCPELLYAESRPVDPPARRRQPAAAATAVAEAGVRYRTARVSKSRGRGREGSKRRLGA